MVRKLSIALAAALLSSTSFAQGPMHDTWDINAPNGEPMQLGQPLIPYTGAAVYAAPMHETWDINAPNGEPAVFAAAPTPDAPADPAVHGHATTVAAPDRVIEVGPGTRYVNVTSGETVMFKVGRQSFSWTFDATLHHPSFDLARIAPAGMAAQGVRIYCAPDQYERLG